MTDTDLPEWDNHGSPVDEPTGLDIAIATVKQAVDDYDFTTDYTIVESVSAALLDAFDIVPDRPWRGLLEAGLSVPITNEVVPIVLELMNDNDD